MAKFASGKKAWAISDRSGFRYPYRLMKKEWNGLLVGPDEFEPKQPQLGPFRKVVDPEALQNPRPDRVEPLAVYVGMPLVVAPTLGPIQGRGSSWNSDGDNMSFTYAQLKDAIQDYTDNTEASFVTNLPVFITQAEERILKNVQLSLFRKNVSGAMTSGNRFLAAPTDFLAPFSLSFIDGSSDHVFLQLKDPDFVQSFNPDAATTGSPRFYATFDVDNFILGPTPNSAYAVELHYFYRPASLIAGAASGTTWLSTNAEIALLYGSLLEAYIYMKGEQDMMALYEKRFAEAVTGMKLFGEAQEVTDEYRTGQVIRPKQ